jgi:hypothetical protein
MFSYHSECRLKFINPRLAEGNIWFTALTRCSQILHAILDELKATLEIRGFGGMLSPVEFSAQTHSTSELLRFL